MILESLQKRQILNTLFKIFLLLLNCQFVSNTDNIGVIYIKTNGIITEMKLLNESNYEQTLCNLSFDKNNILKKEIDSNYIDSIILKISKNESESFISFGILLQLNNQYYDLNDYVSSFNEDIICNTTTIIYIDNNTNEKEIIECSQNNIEDI